MRPNRVGAAGRLLLVLALLVVLGIPLVAYLWETGNQLLAGHVNGRRLSISAPLAAAFAALLWFGSRALARLSAPPPGQPPGAEPVVSGTLLLTALLLMVIFGGWAVGYFLLLER